MQREPHGDHRNHQTHAIKPDGEGDSGGDDEVDLNARVTTELAHKKKSAIYSAMQIRSAAAMSLMRWKSGASSATTASARLAAISGRYLPAPYGEHAGIDQGEDGDEAPSD